MIIICVSADSAEITLKIKKKKKITVPFIHFTLNTNLFDAVSPGRQGLTILFYQKEPVT